MKSDKSAFSSVFRAISSQTCAVVFSGKIHTIECMFHKVFHKVFHEEHVSMMCPRRYNGVSRNTIPIYGYPFIIYIHNGQ